MELTATVHFLTCVQTTGEREGRQLAERLPMDKEWLDGFSIGSCRLAIAMMSGTPKLWKGSLCREE
jgi:hypothetical protein